MQIELSTAIWTASRVSGCQQAQADFELSPRIYDFHSGRPSGRSPLHRFFVQSAMSYLKLEAQDGRADTYHKLSGQVEDTHQRPPGGGTLREDRALFHHCIGLRSRDVHQKNFQPDFTEHTPTCSYAVWHLMFNKDFPSLSLLVDSQLHTAIERFCKRQSANAN